MPICNFICPFDPVTRQTTLPLDKDGQSYLIDWVHLTRERGSTVVVQVRAEQTIIDAMKADSKYFFLEQKSADTTKPAPMLTDPLAAKTFIGKTATTADLNKQVWTTPEKAVESVVKLMGATVTDYKAGGLGDLTVAKAKEDDPVVIEK